MPRFIEEFYYGNIDPQARSTKEMFVVKSVMNSRIFVVFFVIEHFLQLIKAQRRFAI